MRGLACAVASDRWGEKTLMIAIRTKATENVLVKTKLIDNKQYRQQAASQHTKKAINAIGPYISNTEARVQSWLHCSCGC